MGLFPEREPIRNGVEQVVDEIKIPEHLKSEGIKGVETAIKANVKIGNQQVINTPQNQVVQIKIPKTSTALEIESKGDIDDGVTWLALHWLRQIKRAMYFGWKIVWGNNAS